MPRTLNPKPMGSTHPYTDIRTKQGTYLRASLGVTLKCACHFLPAATLLWLQTHNHAWRRWFFSSYTAPTSSKKGARSLDIEVGVVFLGAADLEHFNASFRAVLRAFAALGRSGLIRDNLYNIVHYGTI